LINERIRSRSKGQALVEMIVVMPVLLLLLLAAADMGKLFVISGKSEISARYIALSHFREAPFGDAYIGQTAGQEIEGLFFDDALDDSGEADGPDVTYQELGDEDLLYAPNLEDDLLINLWDNYLNLTDQLIPIRGARSTFSYDLPRFPYGREHPMEGTQVLQDAPSEGRLAATYDATGNFVMLADSFSGARGEALRLALEGAGLIVGAASLGGLTAVLVAGLWIIFLP
jgi:hypothetical protein